MYTLCESDKFSSTGYSLCKVSCFGNFRMKRSYFKLFLLCFKFILLYNFMLFLSKFSHILSLYFIKVIVSIFIILPAWIRHTHMHIYLYNKYKSATCSVWGVIHMYFYRTKYLVLEKVLFLWHINNYIKWSKSHSL